MELNGGYERFDVTITIHGASFETIFVTCSDLVEGNIG